MPDKFVNYSRNVKFYHPSKITIIYKATVTEKSMKIKKNKTRKTLIDKY